MLPLVFSRDFVVAFFAYVTLLGVLLIFHGIILAACVDYILNRNRDRK